MEPDYGPASPENAVQVVHGVLGMAATNVNTKGQQKVFKKMSNIIDFMDKGWKRLDSLLGDSPRKLRDAEYVTLTDFCKHNDKWKEYGKRPRTLALLRWVGCPEAIDGFVQDNLSDYALPYTERNLPRSVKGQQLRAKFLELQQYVLATNQIADLEREGGQHLNIRDQQYFDTIKRLGRGGFGVVDHVVSRLSLRQYALKRIPRGQSFKQNQAAIRTFENELGALKILSHKHLVKLVGSYTDHDHIGLIMTPVADMNLEQYLNASEQDCPDRKNCLRQFFGCLAAGVEYLHSQKIRHKDIKPKNVLVLLNYQRVLLTDFGTAHNWSDDTGGSSSGTIHEAFTTRYCAPEVFKQTRNESSDIWSLGCIFLEMSTVLSGLTLQQMQYFFQENGNGCPFIWQNQSAFGAWYDKLSQRLDMPSDSQVLDLGKRLCHLTPIERPTAAQIASEIVDFQGPIPYHCGCCEEQSDACAKADMVQDMQNITKNEEWNMTGPESPIVTGESLVQEPGSVNTPEANYQPPSFHEIQDNMTVMYYDENARPICRPKNTDLVPQEQPCYANGDDEPTVLASPPGMKDLAPKIKPPEAVSNGHLSPLTLHCEWPRCTALFTQKGDPLSLKDSLTSHHRSVHGSHDFGRTARLLDISSPSNGYASAKSDSVLDHGQLVNFIVTTETEEDPTVREIRRALKDRRDKRRKPAAEVPLVSKPLTSKHVSSTADTGALEGTSSDSDAKDPPSSPRLPRPPVRFAALPADRRPEETAHTTEEIVREPDFDLNEPVREPLIQAWWPALSQLPFNGLGDSDGAAISLVPEASFVPSFHLAATNQLTNYEVDRLNRGGSTALFVYGSLMFPAILQACAQFYVSEEGVYSSEHQRRLKTSSSDWAFVNESMVNAAAKMTPAVVSGYSRAKVKRRPWAFARQAYIRSADLHTGVVPDELHGFVISGLSDEAHLCLSHWHNEEMPTRLGFSRRSNQKSKSRSVEAPIFSRLTGAARILQVGGIEKTVSVAMFHCLDHRYDVPATLGHRALPPWDINQFIRSDAYPRLSEGVQSKQEHTLARTMRIRFVLRGDVLCSAVLRGKQEEVLAYLEKDYDIDARCRVYGTALQAAAAKGKDEMAMLLMAEGADVNAFGGRYKTPLIAAVVHGNEDLAKELIRKRAKVLATGGQYVNALYQAVSFSDISMAHMLLEKGAWLSHNYFEIQDLALENGNRNMIRMLEDYDVRGLWKKRLLERESSGSGNDANDSVTYLPYDERRALEKRSSLSLVRAVLMEALSLKGQRGKWTGIKAVRLLQTAIRMGASESIIESAAPFLSDYERLIEVVTQAFKQRTEEMETRGLEASSRSQRREVENGESSTLVSRRSRHREAATSTSASLRDTGPNYYSSDQRQQSNSNLNPREDASGEVFCLTCAGRGGKAGTERTCNECNGSTSIWSRSGVHSKKVTCPACRGRGFVFSSRDICRACNNGAAVGLNTPPQSPIAPSASRVRFAQGVEPPPPYAP